VEVVGPHLAEIGVQLRGDAQRITEKAPRQRLGTDCLEGQGKGKEKQRDRDAAPHHSIILQDETKSKKTIITQP
jgi:hypothetical protein